MNSTTAEKPCMTQNCKSGLPEHSRGVCANCYSRIMTNVKKGLISEREAIRTGMILKTTGRGRKNRTIEELKRRQAAKKIKASPVNAINKKQEQS